ncbi:MAG TPA: NAD-dependent malic enzyme [Candidatus Limnocylindrales bacterium]|nr:NAD-dependent malic enzyme [Candidatus Limnocylindrales bacterium]
MKYRITAEGILETGLSGFDLINFPLLNKGTAFTEDERTDFALHGLLPPHVGNLEDQAARRLKALRDRKTDFGRYAYLRDLQDTNETLFYAVLVSNIEEMMPLVYTPTVGEGCQRFSEIWRKPRGLFLSYPNRHKIREILEHHRYDAIRAIVVSDGERILGLGDQGAGGMGIPIGKLALYTACAGIHPQACLPVLLDVGTDNVERLEDPLYVGWRHQRVRGAEYDDFVEAFVSAVIARCPRVLLQWEDFAGINAGRLLERYRDRLCTFNDDIQGTAAVAAGTLLAAINVTGMPLTEQRIVLFGVGSAGIGIATLLLTAMKNAGLSEAEARRHFYAVDKDGLLVEGMPDTRPAQQPFVQPRSAIANWKLDNDHISLLDVVRNAKPTTLIGVSGQAGAFTEEVIRAMAASVDRPVIFPLSNPTSRSEATPADLLKWTEGRALIGTGSPFAAVNWNGRELPIDQTNNSYIFPGIGLGILSVNARRATDTMFMAAARCLAELSPARRSKSGRLLPPVSELRSVSFAVAKAVARQAINDGVAGPLDEQILESRIRANVWEPVYLPYRFDPCP